MTADDFRGVALDMPGAVEGSHMKHPDFRANGRIFASLNGDETRGTVMVTPEEQAELIRLSPKAFEPASGAWGRQGCTTVHLSSAGERDVRGAMTLAWQRAAEKPPPKKRRRPGQP